MSIATSSVITALGSAGKRAIGDINLEIHSISIISGDTGSTSTCASLSTVLYGILVANVRQTAAPTYSGRVATFTFADPVASVVGSVLLFGR